MAVNKVLLLVAIVAGAQIASATMCMNTGGTRTFYYDILSAPFIDSQASTADACCASCDEANDAAGNVRACTRWSFMVDDLLRFDEGGNSVGVVVPAGTCRLYGRGNTIAYGSLGKLGSCTPTSVNGYPVPLEGEGIIISSAAECCDWAVNSDEVDGPDGVTQLEVRGFVFSEGVCYLATEYEGIPDGYAKAESQIGLYSMAAYGEDDPHFRAFGGAWYEFFGYPDAVFNVLTAPKHQVNALFSNLGNERVVNNYMTKIGFMTEAAAFEVGLTAENGLTVTALVNGKPHASLTSNMQSGIAYLVAPGVKAMKLPYTPKKTAGETIVLATSQLAVSVYTRDGENWLDLNIDLLDRGLPDMHGIVGQTWRGHTGVVPKVVNGTHVLEGAEPDYEVVDGVLGKTFKFNQFELPAITQGQTFSFSKTSAAAIKQLGKVVDAELTTSKVNARRLLNGATTSASPIEMFLHSMDTTSVAFSSYAA